MLDTIRAIAVFVCLSASVFLPAACQTRPSYPSFDYDSARAHELKPHRRTIPLEGVRPGFHQLRLTLMVSPGGEVVHADASGDEMMEFWPELRGEVNAWKFTPFERGGKAVTAEVEEYIDLVPPERLPARQVAAPVVRSDSKVAITLERTGCFGSCPGYTVTVATDGIVFEGRLFVAAVGRHTDTVVPDNVRDLARHFVAADFYSMDTVYRAGVTDNPTYIVGIVIDGHTKQVEDYVGSWVGMPAVIKELEDEVDTFARTSDGLKGVKDWFLRCRQSTSTFTASMRRTC
jgi:hypothetical protein